MKEVYFISGLPRSGSTLLTDLLAQNEEFYCSPTSGVRDMVELVKNNWNSNEHFIASHDMKGVNEMIKGILQGYYSVRKEPVIFDKNRGWPGSLEMANFLSKDGEAKVIVTVRDITDILSSFEKMYRNNAHNFMISTEKGDQAGFKTLAGRCESWVKGTGIIGGPYTGILEALKRGHGDNILFVEYDNLCIDPEKELKRIYKFLEKKWKDKIHYYDKVVSKNFEYEISRGHPQDLHAVRSKVEFKKSDAINILGKELFDKYSNAEFWRQQ